MKSNRKDRETFTSNRKGFTFIVPLTIAIVVGIALLSIGSYVVGVLGDALAVTYPDNKDSGYIYVSYWDNDTIAGSHKLNLTTTADSLRLTDSKFYIYAGGSAQHYNLTVNGQEVNRTDNISEGEGWNTTFAYLISNSSINGTDRVLTFDYTATVDGSSINMVAVGSYYVAGDWRTANQNKTIVLIGDVVDGMSGVVDIEIVVIIITTLSMAIIAIMAVGSKRKLF